jgi:hypothetical protein
LIPSPGACPADLSAYRVAEPSAIIVELSLCESPTLYRRIATETQPILNRLDVLHKDKGPGKAHLCRRRRSSNLPALINPDYETLDRLDREITELLKDPRSRWPESLDSPFSALLGALGIAEVHHGNHDVRTAFRIADHEEVDVSVAYRPGQLVVSDVLGYVGLEVVMCFAASLQRLRLLLRLLFSP